MLSTSLHKFSRNEVDLKREMHVLRESTKQALELAWNENTEKENKIAALERQIQDMMKREICYKQQIGDLTKQARRNSGNSRSSQSLPKGSFHGGARALESFVASPRIQLPSPSMSQKRRPSITPPCPIPNIQRRPSASSSVGDIFDFFSAKKSCDVDLVEQERADQIAQLDEQRRAELEEAHAKLESQGKLIENLERANRKHVRTILALQEELANLKKELNETELSFQARLQEKRETISKQVKDLQRYQAYVVDLTNELEKVYGRDSSHVKARNASSKKSPHGSSRVLTAHQA